MLETCRLPLVAESRIKVLIAPLGQGAANTLGTGVLEVQDANSVAYLPRASALGADLYDHSSRLVRWYYRQLGSELAVHDLKVGVTEARGVDLDQELGVPDTGNVNSHQLVRFVVLPIISAAECMGTGGVKSVGEPREGKQPSSETAPHGMLAVPFCSSVGVQRSSEVA
jgi:hypothetical protein